jgi:hypothetical protein
MRSSHKGLLAAYGSLWWSFPAGILYSCHFSTIQATCPAHPILVDLITLVINNNSTQPHVNRVFFLFSFFCGASAFFPHHGLRDTGVSRWASFFSRLECLRLYGTSLGTCRYFWRYQHLGYHQQSFPFFSYITEGLDPGGEAIDAWIWSVIFI